MEFKFDDTRLSYWHKNKIGRIEIFFCCFLTLLIFCPVSWVSFAETSQQGRKLAKSGSNKKNFQFCQSYSYVNRKVWYHQIWIPNNLDFMVLILMYVPTSFVCIVFKSEVNGVKVHLDLDIQFWSRKYFCWNEKPCICKAFGKVIYTKYSKHWPYTVAHTIDCVCRNVKSWFKSWVFPFTFQAYTMPHTLCCKCLRSFACF